MLSIYIHIPFCLSKCGYCDFYSVPIRADPLPVEDYSVAILGQLHETLEDGVLKDKRISTIYFGGGTPSLMPPSFFKGIIGALKGAFDFDQDVEISCEVNPATVNQDWFDGIYGAGVNRISIGVQSFQPNILEFLGRLHSSDDAMQAIEQAKGASFDSVNIDLIYAIPGQTVSELEDDLRSAMTFHPGHLSAYQLTIDEGCKFFDAGIELPDEDLSLKMMRLVAHMLGRMGHERYEISNFAKPEFRCRHNLNYWRYGEYLGLGAGATSFLQIDDDGEIFGNRWMQIKNFRSYISRNALTEMEKIDHETAMGEFCFMGLRTIEGISKARFFDLFGKRFDDLYGAVTKELIERDLAVDDEASFRLAAKGLEISNDIFQKFIIRTAHQA